MNNVNAGLLGIALPASLGGGGGDWLDFAAAYVAAVGADGDLGQMMGLAGQAWALKAVLDHGDAGQIAKIVPSILAGAHCATALAEPASGTDMAALVTRLQANGGGFVLEGQKRNISFGQEAQWLIALAQGTDERHQLVLLDRARHPWSAQASPAKIGLAHLPTADLSFHSISLLPTDLLAPDRNALLTLADFMTFGRALMGLGIAAILQAHLQTIIEFAETRHSQGRALTAHQYIQHKLTDSQLAITQTQTLANAALHAHLAQQSEAIALGAMTKITATTALLNASRDMLAILGTSGFQHHAISQLAVDALAFQAIGGTEEAHRMSLWKQMQRGFGRQPK